MSTTAVIDEPRIAAPIWGEACRVGPGRWRVSDRRGLVVGHIRAHREDKSWRYAAERFHAASRSFRVLGDFWAVRDAIDCLRYA